MQKKFVFMQYSIANFTNPAYDNFFFFVINQLKKKNVCVNVNIDGVWYFNHYFNNYFLEKVIGLELFSTINLSMMLLLLFHTFSRVVSAAHWVITRSRLNCPFIFTSTSNTPQALHGTAVFRFLLSLDEKLHRYISKQSFLFIIWWRKIHNISL